MTRLRQEASPGAPDLLAILGNQARARNGGMLADRVAEAFTELLREPFRRDSAHELETIEVIGVDGEKRAIRIFPRAWIARLEKAVEVGAFGKLEVHEIVARILTTEPAS